MSTSGRPILTGWRAEINPNRTGAGFFLSQERRIRFEPADYIEFRSLTREFSVTLRREWSKWLQDLKNSSFKHIRRTAGAAPAMTQDHLDDYYKDRIVRKRKLDVLESSAEQLTTADRELSSLLAAVAPSQAAAPATVAARATVAAEPKRTSSKGLIEEELNANGSKVKDGVDEVEEVEVGAEEAEEFGHSPLEITAPVLFPTTTNKELYAFAKSILDNWEESSKVEQKDCLVALSGIVNTLDRRQELIITEFNRYVNRMRLDDLFLVTDRQRAIFRKMIQVLRVGEQVNLRRLRRFCSESRDKLEEEEELGWPESGAEEKIEELRVTHVLEFLCEEILRNSKVAKNSEHEEVFVWRGIARILQGHNVVVRVGELGCSATRGDRVEVESQFGGAESNVRSRKIDILHQLCPEGSKPIDLVAWEAKSEAVSSENLQIQQRKNIRINASVMNKLSQYLDSSFPRPAPIILDIVGPRALAYMVTKVEPGIFVAGAVAEDMIELPKSADGIENFLEGGSLSALLRVADINTAFAQTVKQGYFKSERRKAWARMSGQGFQSKEGPAIIFTPTKKQKQRQVLQQRQPRQRKATSSKTK